MTHAPTLVVDASVVVKWYVPEHGSPAAIALLGGPGRLLAPDLLVAEFGNTLRKKTRRGELKSAEGEAIVQAFLARPPVTLYASMVLLQPAWELALGFGQTIYDALYLALAVAEDCPLITADAALVRTLHGTPLRDFVKPLTSWTSSKT